MALHDSLAIEVRRKLDEVLDLLRDLLAEVAVDRNLVVDRSLGIYNKRDALRSTAFEIHHLKSHRNHAHTGVHDPAFEIQ